MSRSWALPKARSGPAAEAVAAAGQIPAHHARPATRSRDLPRGDAKAGYYDHRLGGSPDVVLAPMQGGLEREAAAVASGLVHRPADAGAARPLSRYQPEAHRTGAQPAPPSVRHTLLSQGEALPGGLRRYLGRRLGDDLAHVRLHRDAAAADAARDIGAQAFASGRHIAFGAGAYRPDTPGGLALVAHELAHVLQQRGASSLVQRSPQPGTGESLADGPSPAARFWLGVAATGLEWREQQIEDARRLAEESVARMLREQRLRLIYLQDQIRSLERGNAYETLDGQERRLAALRKFEEERQAIFDAYDPSYPRRSQSRLPQAAHVPLSYGTTTLPLQGPLQPSFPQSAPDIAPDKPARFGKFGGLLHEHDAVRSSVADAYGYDIETQKFQVADDLERLARAGYTEIHIATGTHGAPQGTLDAEFDFLRQDARSILDTAQRHPGLRIIPYNMADAVQVARFNAAQLLAAEGRLPGGATMAAYCFSRTNIPDPNQGPAGPHGTVEVLEPRGPLGATFLHGGLAVGAGVLSISSGMQDPNRGVGMAKMAGGGAQVVGGMSYAAGHARDSLGLVRFGSRANAVGGAITAPLALVDFYRGMQQKFDPGAVPESSQEALYGAFEDTAMLAGAFFPQAALAALALQFGLRPAAEAVAERVAPTFVESMSGAYGIPSQYLWGWN
ncbi:hypothetical protein DFH01_20035 [Falsiroseomonas bella]|uniref:eCIS core domain-containing protein n=1 Tax=Falsiroseomonas bella TaxID=2184016 RepID=A0A317F9R2_9PROT|nr:DUF4157 domain-containing protein [Falsiroseomonas bella]PWS35860.1 hypothetical protein DFH01_20035 [Falsiroseomonas bella]